MDLDYYKIDPSLSSITMRAFTSSAFPASGNSPTLAVRDFAGWARFMPGTIEDASVQIRMSAASLAVVEDIGGASREEIVRTMTREILETDKYPEIVFCSSKASASRAGEGQYWVNLVGDLSLHGARNSEALAAQILLIGETLRAHGEMTLLQMAYNIEPKPIAGGALKLKNEMKCAFDLLAWRQPGHEHEAGEYSKSEA
ncbi:MAG TPA: YceI family protein [Bryobacteraceae bacterium]|nr:YceI family protein [Bryobacteraceae bacterium]